MDTMKTGKIYKLISESKRICFIGDSITDRTKNGGIGWYEALEKIISGEIINNSWGGITSKLLIKDHLNEIIDRKANLFIIDIGTNDVRYRNDNCESISQ